MIYWINGAGPVGLMTACLLYITDCSRTILIYEKRLISQRDHSLSISAHTIDILLNCLGNNKLSKKFSKLIRQWSDKSVLTSEIECTLIHFIDKKTTIKIFRGFSVPALVGNNDEICLIGADGAHSQIRRDYFDDSLSDEHISGYMVQLKFKTSQKTKNRRQISAIAYSLLNSVSGHDIVLDFESFSHKGDTGYKSGTLHIPINENVYQVLAVNDRGTFKNPWKLEELKNIDNQSIRKLVRIIKRYRFSLACRQGQLIDDKITVLPLKVYRCTTVAKQLNNCYVFLVGDASSGLIYQRGLNKGWIEVSYLINCLLVSPSPDIAQYNYLCQNLYNKELHTILKKSNKISTINRGLTFLSLSIITILLLIIGWLIVSWFKRPR